MNSEMEFVKFFAIVVALSILTLVTSCGPTEEDKALMKDAIKASGKCIESAKMADNASARLETLVKQLERSAAEAKRAAEIATQAADRAQKAALEAKAAANKANIKATKTERIFEKTLIK